MTNTITLRRGYDISLRGAVDSAAGIAEAPASVIAICPEDYPGFVPKLLVREGEEVKCGTPIMRDKSREGLVLVSPAPGRVRATVRGERRRIMRVEIETTSAPRGAVHVDRAASRQEIVASLCASGLFAWLRQRPYDVVPDPEVTPRDIFITAFDTAPLAPAPEVNQASAEALKAGIDLLGKLTDGSVYIGCRPGQSLPTLNGATIVAFRGPHPAGNAGVQINHIRPVCKGDVVWTLSLDTLSRIGSWALTGFVDYSTVVALTGCAVEKPQLIRTSVGAAVEPLLKGNLIADRNVRIISGNPLTGTHISQDGYIRFPYTQLTAIAEGDDRYEFMGWASLSPSKLSASRTFPAAFTPKRALCTDAMLHGARRAMIMSGVYDRMLPMDILPEPLIKAILSRNIEQMEALGIYEVAPEDFALAEWADPSKLPLQQIVREGLDFLRAEV